MLSGLFSCKDNNDPDPGHPGTTVRELTIDKVTIAGQTVANNGKVKDVQFTARPVVRIEFSDTIVPDQLTSGSISLGGNIGANFSAVYGENNKTLVLTAKTTPVEYTKYTLTVSSGANLGGKITNGFTAYYVTKLDSTYKFPVISDDSLLTLVQKQTFSYFWDYAHPVSGLARERYGSGETVTSGGSGFGIMTIPVAIERHFITRNEGFDRLNKIVTFLNEKAVRFHGAYPHWINGSTGAVVPFSTNDDGADLVETSFLMQGLLTARQYFKNGTGGEKAMCDTIEKLWRDVEWTWFQQNGQKKLFWHWSPDYGWNINMQISGWDEALVTYVLAASSPTHPIEKSVYDNGWAANGGMKNGNSYYNVTLPLGPAQGGPLFFAHYSFLGLDPRTLSDAYANYWTQNTAHAKINYSYCVANPAGNLGYSNQCWGLTASDYPSGYTASSPANDQGTIAPTAALASMPYTPEESMRALRFFYYVLGNKIWGTYGFRDAFNLNSRWFADSYLAIDQGPIVVMIENYRSALLWKLFMQDDDIRVGLTKLGFSY